MTPLGYGAAALAAITLLRIEHLIASDLWIVFKGHEWARDVRTYTPKEQSNAVAMWRLYKKHDGGKMPFLFFGIKSYRLYAVYARPKVGRVVRLSLMAVRFLWRWYVYIPATVALIAAACLSPSRPASMVRVSLLVAASALVVGMIAIAAEGTLSSFEFDGSWAVLYHRWPAPGGARRKAALKELTLFVGCLILSICAAVALVLTSATQFDAYKGFPANGSAVDKIGQAVGLAVPGVFGAAWPQVGTGAGLLANALVLLLYIAYVFIFGGVGLGRLLKKKGPRFG